MTPFLFGGYYTFHHLWAVAKKDKENVENVSLPTAYVNKLRENKKSTGVPIRTFICQAIDEKLKLKPL